MSDLKVNQLNIKQSSVDLLNRIQLVDECANHTNSMTDGIWVFYDPVNKIEFKLELPGPELNISSTQSFILKKMIENHCLADNGQLTVRENEIRGIRNNLCYFFNEVSERFPHRTLCSLSEAETTECLCAAMGLLGNRKTLAWSSVLQLRSQLGNIENLYLHAYIPDGLTEIINLTNLASIAKIYLVEYTDIDAVDWFKGGSIGDIPLPIALLGLTESLDIIRSPKLEILRGVIAYFVEHSSEKAFYGKQLELRDYWALPYHKRKTQAQNEMDIFKFSAVDWIADYLDMPDKYNANLRTDWPFKNMFEMEGFQRQVFNSGLNIILTLSGMRISEVNSIRKCDVFKTKLGHVKFRSKIKKTNYSVPTERDIDDLALEVVEALEKASFATKADTLLFQYKKLQFKTVSEMRVVDIGQVRVANYSLKMFYTKLAEKYGKFVLEHMDGKTPSTHEFRHTFAAFCLLRFTGYIPPEIANHFRHKNNSWMTKHYTYGKIYMAQGGAISKDVLVTIMGRYLEGEEELYGGTANWIKDEIAKFKQVTVQDLHEISEQLDGTIEAHEYGFCLIRSKTKHLSKCYDRKSNTAKSGAATFKECSGCAHRLTLGSQKENTIRIGQSISSHVNSFDDAGLGFIADAFRTGMRCAEAALVEISEPKII
ncbi:MAG: site-specific integrase [Oleispira sp.]|nr:site-specific integrase [Oleispira sp.]MBL4881539.1 site-specific integrase [Oleispira sp.]